MLKLNICYFSYHTFNLHLQIVAVGPSVPPEFAIGKRVCVENHYYCGKCYQCTHGELIVYVCADCMYVCVCVHDIV